MVELREPYKNNTIRTYEAMEEFFAYKKEFSKDNLSQDRDSIENDLRNNVKDVRVWLLFGKKTSDDKSENKWECLQVGHSKNNVITEIINITNHLCTKENFEIEEYSNSVFYTNVCPKVTIDYCKYLYGTIGNLYSNFSICFLNVDKYLGIKETDDSGNTDTEKIIAICKNQYAEAKVAYETLAKYWRLYSSGIDGQTIAYFAENKG